MAEIKLTDSWKKRLQPEFQAETMVKLREFLSKEIKLGKKIFPEPSDWLAALNLTPFDDVKVVIVGQDPYHGPGQAHGLSFSVQDGIAFPPSLKNIFKELQTDVGIAPPKSGNLKSWAEKGVLLLNNALTVEQSQPASHQGKGWELLTDRVIHLLNEEKENLVFILWGSFAQKKAHFVDRKKHFVIESPHPSPLSSYRGFFDSRPFSKANKYLQSKKITPIDWSL